MIEAVSLSVSLSGRQILSDVTFSLEGGQWMMVAAPNGAGKTTLINAIAQNIPYTGSVSVNGEDLHRMKSRLLARRVGVLAQNQQVNYEFFSEEIIRLGCYSHREGLFSPIGEESEKLYRDAVRDTGVEELLHRPVTKLSGGEVQRVFLAQLFAQDPCVMLLDEPTSHLDLVYQKQIFELVDAWRKRKNRAVISVVHDITMAKHFGTHALLLENGRSSAFGKKEDVLTAENLNRVFGIDVSAWMKTIYEEWT